MVAKDVNGKETGLQITERFSLRASCPFRDIVKSTRASVTRMEDAWIASLAQMENLLAGYREFQVSLHFSLDTLSERERERERESSKHCTEKKNIGVTHG